MNYLLRVPEGQKSKIPKILHTQKRELDVKKNNAKKSLANKRINLLLRGTLHATDSFDDA